MTYHEYIFRFPAGTPELTYAALTAWMGVRDSRMIGATVTVTAIPETGGSPACFEIWLYETRIACISPDEVSFPGPDDPHMATTEWIAKIIRDNGIGEGAGRIRRRKADGPGPEIARGRAGLLTIGWNRGRPVFGQSYPVDYGKIAENRDFRERWAAEMAFRNTHPVQWAADLAAAKPGGGCRTTGTGSTRASGGAAATNPP